MERFEELEAELVQASGRVARLLQAALRSGVRKGQVKEILAELEPTIQAMNEILAGREATEASMELMLEQFNRTLLAIMPAVSVERGIV